MLAHPAAAASWRETFATNPFDRAHPRWCERYHHGHWVDHAITFTRSSTDHSECTIGTGLACSEAGCGPCDCCTGSPCSKVGDPLGNAVIQTTADHPGTRRVARARFRIGRQLPIGQSHLAIYAALHPHCHSTAQAILVPDRPGVFHLNVAAFNQFIGGDPQAFPECARDSLTVISPTLAREIPLVEGHTYLWTLAARLDASGSLVMASKVTTPDAGVLGSGRFTITADGIAHWFGRVGRAARFGFGSQFSPQPSPSGGEPAVELLAIDGSARD